MRTPFFLHHGIVWSLCCLVVIAFVVTGCAESDKPAEAPELDVESIAERMLEARHNAQTAEWLMEELPELSVETGQIIQKIQLEKELADGFTRVGWKMGGTRVTDPTASPSPSYGYSLSSHMVSSDVPVPPGQFVGEAPLVEAEVAIWIGKDLVGPQVSKEELIDAVSGVGGAIEIVSPRLVSDTDIPTPAQLYADNVAHAGALAGDLRVPIESFDFDAEEAVAFVDGEEMARGSSKDIMGTVGTPLDAALWLANELPKHGLHLKAGEFILTGSLYDNPTMLPGQSAEIRFTTLGTLSVSVASE